MTTLEFLTQLVLGYKLSTWLTAIGAAALAWVLINVVKRQVCKWLTAKFRDTRHRVDDYAFTLCKRMWLGLKFGTALYIITALIAFPHKIETNIQTAASVLLLIQVAIWGTDTISFLIRARLQARDKLDGNEMTTLQALGFIGKVLLWSIIVLLVLDNLPHVEVDTLIASLGITSVAVALAVQNVLGDLFASLSIIFDKPFVVGDFISVDEYSGTVTNIGLRSTRIRCLTGETLILSNTELATSPIRNYKQMEKRRVAFDLNVTYQTSHDNLVAIPGILETIISDQPQSSFDRAHFKAYGEYALVFEIVYYIESSDYNLYMDIQQAINLEIYRRFAAAGIDFAYPTQTLRMQKRPTTSET